MCDHATEMMPGRRMGLGMNGRVGVREGDIA